MTPGRPNLANEFTGFFAGAGAFLLASFVVLGAVGAPFLAGVDSSISGCIADQPWTVRGWVGPAATELGVLGLACLFHWLTTIAFTGRRSPRAWAIVYFAAASFLVTYGTAIHVWSWRHWNGLEAQDGDIAPVCDPIIADTVQIPLGLAVFGVILAAHLFALMQISDFRLRRKP